MVSSTSSTRSSSRRRWLVDLLQSNQQREEPRDLSRLFSLVTKSIDSAPRWDPRTIDHVVKLLAVSDEEDPSLTVSRLRRIQPDLVVSCGDLGPDYLDFVCSAANAPLFYVPGNHDPDQGARRDESEYMIESERKHELITNTPRRPSGLNLDSSVLTDLGLRFAGFGGSVRYRPGPNQYTQRRMKRKVRAMIRREWLKGLGRVRPIDVFVAHSPPSGVGDGPDPAHQGFEAFHRLIDVMKPRLMLHGHIHPHGFAKPDLQLGDTTIINVIPHRVLDLR